MRLAKCKAKRLASRVLRLPTFNEIEGPSTIVFMPIHGILEIIVTELWQQGRPPRFIGRQRFASLNARR